MADVVTSRDLYRFIADLVKQRSESCGTLQQYLENLRRLGGDFRERERFRRRNSPNSCVLRSNRSRTRPRRVR